MKAATSAHSHGNQHDDEYNNYLASLTTRFNSTVANGSIPVFTTDDTENLWDIYLDSFSDPVERQHHNCHACRHFIQRFGGLVTISEKGVSTSAIWNPDDAPPNYKRAVEAMSTYVARAPVNGVFYSSEKVWGQPRTGEWTHLAITPPKSMIHKGIVHTAGQKMAEKREDYWTVQRALAAFSAETVDTAVSLLKADALYHSEKVLGQAEWLLRLHAARNRTALHHRKMNVVWLAIATAPPGFCHPRTSMIGTLLEDIASGLNFEQVSRRFADKMHPLRYQRPQSAPTAGNIAQAEKQFEKLGLAPALERRIARLEEVPKTWEPRQEKLTKSTGCGVFGHLTPKGDGNAPQRLEVPAITITLQKFVQTVIPDAEQIDLHVGHGNNPFIVITTAVNNDAPPLFQWEHPFAWYVWSGGAPASQFSLKAGWVKVAGITRLPARWNDDGEHLKHQGDGLIFLLEGARETRNASAGLFPSLLRSELHGVRSTIEAYSKKATMHGLQDGTAIGWDVRGPGFPVTVRVTSDGRQQAYKIDRWD